MENRRTETARENDDSDIIERDSADFAPSQGGSSGGNLQEDVATQAELERVRDHVEELLGCVRQVLRFAMPRHQPFERSNCARRAACIFLKSSPA
jgi:hypothetical protein